MVKKGKDNHPKREMTSRQISHWEKERKRQRLIFLAGIFMIAAALILVGSGWFLNAYRPMHQTVVAVNGTRFDMAYYTEMLQVRGQGQSVPYLQYLAPMVEKEIERNELVRQAAAALGYTVSDSEVKAKLKESKTSTDRVYMDILRTQMLGEKLTSNYFDSQVPTEAEQVNALAMLLESEKQANEVRARLDKGESFGDIAAELSLDSHTKTNKGGVSWHPKDVFDQLLNSKVPGEYAFGSVVGTLSQPRYDADVSKQVGWWIIKVTEMKADTGEAQVYVILSGNEDEALSLKIRLEAGEDFATLAKQYSKLPGAQDNGGNLGFVTKDTIGEVLGNYVYNPDTKLNTLSSPIRDTSVSTTGGYWLVKLLEKADKRAIDSQDRTLLKSKALNDWVSSLWYNPDYTVESFLDDAKINYAISQIAKT